MKVKQRVPTRKFKVCLKRAVAVTQNILLHPSGRGSLRNLLLRMCWHASILRATAQNLSQAAVFLFPLPVPELECARQSLKCLPMHTIRASQAFFLPLSPFISFLKEKQISLCFLLCTSPYFLIAEAFMVSSVLRAMSFPQL